MRCRRSRALEARRNEIVVHTTGISSSEKQMRPFQLSGSVPFGTLFVTSMQRETRSNGRSNAATWIDRGQTAPGGQAPIPIRLQTQDCEPTIPCRRPYIRSPSSRYLIDSVRPRVLFVRALRIVRWSYSPRRQPHLMVTRAATVDPNICVATLGKPFAGPQVR